MERYRLELLKVKNKSDREELAIVDTFDDGEEAGVWMTCLEVTFTGFSLQKDNSVFAICKSGKKTALVSIGSVEWLKLTKPQKIWLSAWNERAES